MKKIIFLLLLVFSISCVGCSIGTVKLYPGPDLSKSELAFINCPKKRIRVLLIGGKKWQYKRCGSKENAAVLPGPHTFIVKYRRVSSRTDILITYTWYKTRVRAKLEAGHQYKFGLDRRGPYIFDRESRIIISR